MIRDAAEKLHINYSTAKTILRVNRLKNRILRVNKEKKFEIFKVTNANINQSIVLSQEDHAFKPVNPKLKPSSATTGTHDSEGSDGLVDISSKIGGKTGKKPANEGELLRKVFETEMTNSKLFNSDQKLIEMMATTNPANEYSELVRLLMVYSSLKNEVENNNKMIFNLLNYNLNQNLGSIFSSDALRFGFFDNGLSSNGVNPFLSFAKPWSLKDITSQMLSELIVS